jgi:hypothetical protein
MELCRNVCWEKYIFVHTYIDTYIHKYIHTYIYTDRHTVRAMLSLQLLQTPYNLFTNKRLLFASLQLLCLVTTLRHSMSRILSLLLGSLSHILCATLHQICNVPASAVSSCFFFVTRVRRVVYTLTPKIYGFS